MKKTIFIITVSFVMLLTAQHDTNQTQEVLPKTNTTSEIIVQQRIDKEVNSINKDILENTKRTMDNENRINDLFITKVGLQGFLLTLLLTFLSIFGIDQIIKRKIDKKTKALNKKFQKSIDNVREAEIRTIQHIKNSEQDNKKLRGQSQILLINEVTTPVNEDLERIFMKGSSKVQFNCTEVNVRELTYEEIRKELVNKGGLHPTKFKLVIFDNSSADGRKWDQPYLEDYLIPLTKELVSKGIAVLYYSNDLNFPSWQSDFKSITNKHLLTYAKAVPNLYNNAMTVLKLQNLYKDVTTL
ncbi:hypothetical protein H2O64_04560 [Kordia sp. YSTF-M3]|uniref:Uncharacterized protein n=1 Tax=Kordia aestuariivivens TaxID=2759037 RepID=A0ABR7Q5V7_9FLAO|nr:hypothetical protein [Kordia aestuariivivens]MBC8753930.1 hypothetical protein [Kordia aestuariivivens]